MVVSEGRLKTLGSTYTVKPRNCVIIFNEVYKSSVVDAFWFSNSNNWREPSIRLSTSLDVLTASFGVSFSVSLEDVFFDVFKDTFGVSFVVSL